MAHCLPAPISELVKVPESRTTADREEGDGRAYVTAPEEPLMRPAIPQAKRSSIPSAHKHFTNNKA